MALDYRLYLETDRSPEELVNLITNKSSQRGQPLPTGLSFLFDGLSCTIRTEEAEDRIWTSQAFADTVKSVVTRLQTPPD